ncbi:MAG: ZIP family metal transporter [Halieaceae bacterium]|jgi:zinc and cadmium transporter|nr:ZIP family metal transporter [Halieaceae bacterium]
MSAENLTLAAYCTAIIAASLLGGWLPSLLRMTHTRTQLVMSFVAGLMLGVALYHLLPHALASLQPRAGSVHGAIDSVAAWMMLGMILMLMMLRLFHFHQHEFGDDGHDHGADGHAHDGHQHTLAHPLSWVGIAAGQSVHALIDGVALGASVVGAHAAGGFSWLGQGVFFAILLHKPLDALSIISIMKAGGWPSAARVAANVGFALLVPLGAVAFVWGLGQLDNQSAVVGCALAFSAGVFLCISLGDLLPEVHFHSHDRVKLTLAFLLGIGLAYAIRFVEDEAAHGVARAGIKLLPGLA